MEEVEETISTRHRVRSDHRKCTKGLGRIVRHPSCSVTASVSLQLSGPRYRSTDADLRLSGWTFPVNRAESPVHQVRNS